jgi:molybdopterin converting factor small subunit
VSGPAVAGQVTVRLLYFAELRERSGRSEETVVAAVRTAAELYAELGRKHGFREATAGMTVVVNDEIAEWDGAVADGDTVVFLTPFGGGA